MPKPTGVSGQQRIQAPLSAAEPKEQSLAQQTAARLPVPQKMEAAAPAPLENRSIQPAVKPGKWAQTKDFVSQWWSLLKSTDEYVTSDAKVAEIAREIERLRTSLNQTCGSPVISDFIRQESVRRSPWLLEQAREWVNGDGFWPMVVGQMLWGDEILEAALARRPTLLSECLEVNLLKILNNLAKHVKGEAEGPIPPNKMINALMMLGSDAGSKEFAVFKTIEEIDRKTGLSEAQKNKEKNAVYSQVSAHLLKVGLPNGAQDLILPLPPKASSLLYSKLLQPKLPDILHRLGEALKSANQEHVELLAELKRVSSDGEAVADKLRAVARATVQDVLAGQGEKIEEKKVNWLESGLELKSNPMLRAVLSQFLKDCKGEMQPLFEKADTFLYPLIVHILGSMAKQADKGLAGLDKKPLLALISSDLLKDLRDFVEQHPREDLGKAIQNYQKQVSELERIASESIQKIEQEYGDVSAPEMAEMKVKRDNRIREIQKTKQKSLELVKSPFELLVNRLILKMGVDEKGLTPILPIGQKFIADWIKNYLHNLCVESYQEIVEKEGRPPAAAARMTGYQEGRQLIQDMISQLLSKMQVQVNETNRWYRQPLSDLLASPDRKALQPYALPWIVDTVSDLFVHLADSNPLTAGKEKVDMLNGAMQHIAHIAVTKLKDAAFVAQVDALCKMTEGPEKEKEKKKVFGSLVEEIMQKGFKTGFRLPLKDTAAVLLGENLLSLIYKGAEKWLNLQESIPQNDKIVQDRTRDGDAVVKAVKVAADQTGAALSDKLQKIGIALETGVENSLRAALVAAIDREPALKSLNDPVLRRSLFQLLKGDAPVRELLKKADGLAYPLFMHVLARLTEKAEGKRATGAAVINTFLKSIFTFAASHRQELVEAFSKEDKKTFAARFEPLVNEIMKNAGLDAEGLAKIVPFGSGPLSELIKASAFDFARDFYEEVSAKEGESPEKYKKLPGYKEARHFLNAALQDAGDDKGLMSTIKQTLAKGKYRRIIQNSLADILNDLLYEGKVPFEKSWVRKAVKDLVDPSAPHLKDLEGFVQPYIVDSVTDLFAHLALSNPGEAKGDMVQSAMAHLVAIMKAEIKDPELEKKLAEWKALPEGTDEEKRAKAKQKELLRKELFGECSRKILDKADIRAPKALRPFLKKLLTETVVPDQFFRLASDTLVLSPLSPVEELRLQNMGGKEAFNKIVDAMAEKFTPVILQKTQEYAHLVAAKANEKLAYNHLSVQEEAWLGKDVDNIVKEGSRDFQPARNFVEYFLSRILHRGLTKLALKYEEEGDLAGNVALYLRDRFSEFHLKPTLRETIRIYSEQTAPLRGLDQQIDAQRKQAIKEYPKVSEQTAADLARLKRERIQKEQEIDKKVGIKATYQEILKAFEPEVRKLLDDMGYAKAENLPVPYFLKDTIWKNLATSILPDLCLTAAEKLIGSYDMLIPRRKELESEVKKYEDLLTQLHIQTQRKSNKDYRLPAHVRVSPMVSAIERILPNYVEKFAESQLGQKGKDWALKAIDDTLIPMMYSGDKGRAAAHQVEANREEIARWIDQENPATVELFKDRFGKALKDVMKVTMLKSAYHFLHNLETLEQNDPEKLFDFMFNAVPLATDHVKLTTAIAQKQKSLLKKVHIHQIDSLTIFKEFEKAGKLHPAMPGVKEFKALLQEDEHIRQLNKVVDKGMRKGSNWHKNIDRLKELPKEPDHSPESYLEAAKRNQEELLKQIDVKMKDNFFSDFSTYLLKMGGIKGAQDLPGGEPFMKMIWEMTSKVADVEREYSHLPADKKNDPQAKKQAEQKAWEKFVEGKVFQPASSAMIDLVKAAFAPEQLNSYLATICTSLNEKLKAYKLSGDAPPEGDFAKSPAADAKMDDMEARCQVFWQQVKRMLPASVVKELQELPIIAQIPGKKMAEWTRSILREYPLSKMVEMGMTQVLPKLPEKLPISIEEAKEAEKLNAEKDAANIKEVRNQAAQTVPIVVEMLERNLFDNWNRMHEKIDAWLTKTFGQRLADVKTFFDNILHKIFITFFMGPAYKFMRKLVFYGLALWGKVVARDVEVARRNIVMQDPDKKNKKDERTININANLLLNMADEFKKFYPAPA